MNKKLLIADAYKFSHSGMYPENTTNLFSTLTARNSFKDRFRDFYWDKDWVTQEVMKHVSEFFDVIIGLNIYDWEPIKKYLGESISIDIADQMLLNIWELRLWIREHNGDLPIIIKVAKSQFCQEFQTPLITIELHESAQQRRFVWLVNFFETIILQNIWQFTTSATIARDLYAMMSGFAIATCEDREFVRYQGHDFSMRGMSSLDSAIKSGQGHLKFFKGSDTLIAGSNARAIPGTEHSIMTALGKDRELETYQNLLNKFPSGMLSIVSDTWDLWNVFENILPKLKEQILKRDGKIIIRPDSGNPIDIICGTKEQKGSLEYLWEIFGGTVNSKGFKVLNPKIGLVYGDGMNHDSIIKILEKMKKMKFASSNIVFGLGAFIYQYNTRDTLGFAMKATAIQFDGKDWVDLIKDPITDKKKKSLTGRFEI